MKKEYIIGLVIIVLFGAGLATLLLSPENSASLSGEDSSAQIPYIEITNPSGYVNTNDQPVTIGEYVGKKVILLDVMTYSCINCQRTFPYITSWYEKYKDEGLIVIGIHTPEFAFEHDKNNVEAAMKEFGINFPVVLDNEYGTWNAYGNRYWPRKYLIDIKGNIVYDHIGEGAYEETEMKIRELLEDRAKVLGEQTSIADEALVSETVPKAQVNAGSPETYFGAARNSMLENGEPGLVGQQSFVLPETYAKNSLYLGGRFDIQKESATGKAGSSIVYRYVAKEVYIVASAETKSRVEIWQDGVLVGEAGGADVEDGVVHIEESKLYKLIKNERAGEHVLEIKVIEGEVSVFAFTFG